MDDGDGVGLAGWWVCGEEGWEHKDVKEENIILCANQQTDNGGEEQKKPPKKKKEKKTPKEDQNAKQRCQIEEICIFFAFSLENICVYGKIVVILHAFSLQYDLVRSYTRNKSMEY